MVDKTIVCRECGQPFTFSVIKQQQYMRQGLSEPTLCPFCQVAHRAANGGRSADERREAFGGPGGGERAVYAATCSQCGRRTQVPFEPRPGRPIYCSQCYQERNESSGAGRYGGGASSRDREDRNRRRR